MEIKRYIIADKHSKTYHRGGLRWSSSSRTMKFYLKRGAAQNVVNEIMDQNKRLRRRRPFDLIVLEVKITLPEPVASWQSNLKLFTEE